MPLADLGTWGRLLLSEISPKVLVNFFFNCCFEYTEALNHNRKIKMLLPP